LECGHARFPDPTRRQFGGDKLAPGFYSVRVTLAGFLPTRENTSTHSNVKPSFRIELESMFASLDQWAHALERHRGRWTMENGVAIRLAMRTVLEWGGTKTVVPIRSVRFRQGPAHQDAMEFTGWRGPPQFGFSWPLHLQPTWLRQEVGGGTSSDMRRPGELAGSSPRAAFATVWGQRGPPLGAGPSIPRCPSRKPKLDRRIPISEGRRFDQGWCVSARRCTVLRVYGGEYVLVGSGPRLFARPRPN